MTNSGLYSVEESNGKRAEKRGREREERRVVVVVGISTNE